ncbi:MAG: hypothetical protein ABR587_14370 [Candidatus Binatia bacterium]
MSTASPHHDTTENRVDPDALRAAAAGWDNRLHALLIGALMLTATLYPLLLEALVASFGRTAVAVVVALLAAASAISEARRGGPAVSIGARAAVALLGAATALGAGIAPLLLIPACIYAALAGVFFASLRRDISLVEAGARMIQPVAPDFIGPYCRRVTALWAAVLLVNALVLAALALSAPVATWRAAAGYGVWTWMGAISLVEFLVRKTYFRNYYYGGPFERLWSRVFPAEATPMGRRSAAYIRVVREKLAETRQQA